MNDYETMVNDYLEAAHLLEAESDAIYAVLAVLPFLTLVDEDLLDLLAGELTREQVARSASDKEASE
ncbi:hypothetical protein [Streptomyces sp. B1I3]|uniref:hypothetical protein n=1 Tax=Streptomyces sp. B1I3 TaxID=3042264 RepID=UPI002783BA93|nr:hypothetical protein [Streptomyces sp. B1I3]MDQ0793573.1 hypothetical protein [Streptomyces sp. B1I3]